MNSFLIKTIDSDGNSYTDEIISTFDIRDFLKIWDYFEWKSNDSFLTKRKIVFFHPPKKFYK